MLWSDALFAIKQGYYKDNWKFKLGFLMSIFMFLNIKTPFILTHYDFMWLRIPGWSDSEFLSNIQNGINWCLPFVILNYFLVFYKDKWKEIIKEYPNSNKRLVWWYSGISIVLGFGSVFVANLLGWV
jgi:hypothetical protein